MLVTTYVYVTFDPVSTFVELGVFVNVRDGWITRTVAEEVAVTLAPVWSTPVAVAVLVVFTVKVLTMVVMLD